VAGLGPSPLAARIPYALLALALVAAAAVLGEIAVAGAGLPAALLVACPSAYVLLVSALPPPLYPTTLVLLAAVVALAARAAEDFGAAAPPKRGRLILIGLLSADDSRILFVREAALNPPGQGSTGACLSVSATEMLPGGGQNLPGPLNVVAFAGNSLSGAQQGFLIEASGGIPGGGCLTASLQIGDGNTVRYIPMAQH